MIHKITVNTFNGKEKIIIRNKEELEDLRTKEV